MTDGVGNDLRTGERVPSGARVDSGVYAAFCEWVEAQHGDQYANVGRALDRAMLEYMDRDRHARIEEEIGEVREQTALNEALIRQVLDRMSAGFAEKESEKRPTPDDTDFTAPRGKSPGDRQAREAYVIAALVDAGQETVTLGQLKTAIRDVAGISTDRIVKDYVESITDTRAFTADPSVSNRWIINVEAAADLCADHGLAVEVEA